MNEPSIVWTYTIIDLDKFNDWQSYRDQLMMPPRHTYLSWEKCRAAAIRELEGEAEYIRANAEGEEDGAWAEDYDDTVEVLRALDEPSSQEYICGDPRLLDTQIGIGEDGLAVFFYNMILE